MHTPTRKPSAGARDARRHAMEKVAERVGGAVVKGKRPGGYSVVVEHGPWTLTLGLHADHNGSSTVLQTRVLVHFSGREDFKLLVRRRSFLDRVLERLGFGRASTGGREIADRYVVRGRPTSRVRSVLSGGLGEAVLKADAHRVVVRRASWTQRRRSGPSTRSLQVIEPGDATDVDRMTGLLTVAGDAMDVLERVGVALRPA